MSLRFLFIPFIICLLSVDLSAQRNPYKRKIQDVFPDELQYKMSGWYFSPGITYMLPQKFSLIKDVNGSSSGKPRGRLGLYLEFGRYHILKYSKWFKYLDYGISYKSLRGKDLSVGGKFGDHFIVAHFNLNHVKQFSDYNFLQNTIGINADFGIIRNIGGIAPSNPVVQLHYKLGYGFKVNSKLIIIPAIETPILNGLPWERGKSTLGYFNSRYRPLILSVRFLFLRLKREKKCIPVPAIGMPDGYKMPTDMEEPR